MNERTSRLPIGRGRSVGARQDSRIDRAWLKQLADAVQVLTLSDGPIPDIDVALADSGGRSPRTAFESQIAQWAFDAARYRRVVDAATGARRCTATRVSDLTSRALVLIAGRACEAGLRIEDVARDLRCSASRLSHVLGRETGAGFREHVSRVRLERALEWLADPVLSVKEAAARVGWRTADLERHCEHALGAAPGEWRRRLFRFAAVSQEGCRP
jgi:AraC-like DNA-binding protein